MAAPRVGLISLTVGSQWVNTLQNAILMVEVGRDAPTTFFAVNQLPFYGGLPVGLALGIGAVSLTGSVANALLVVTAMFGLGAVIWGRHLQGNVPFLPWWGKGARG